MHNIFRLRIVTDKRHALLQIVVIILQNFYRIIGNIHARVSVEILNTSGPRSKPNTNRRYNFQCTTTVFRLLRRRLGRISKRQRSTALSDFKRVSFKHGFEQGISERNVFFFFFFELNQRLGQIGCNTIARQCE